MKWIAERGPLRNHFIALTDLLRTNLLWKSTKLRTIVAPRRNPPPAGPSVWAVDSLIVSIRVWQSPTTNHRGFAHALRRWRAKRNCFACGLHTPADYTSAIEHFRRRNLCRTSRSQGGLRFMQCLSYSHSLHGCQALLLQYFSIDLASQVDMQEASQWPDVALIR